MKSMKEKENVKSMQKCLPFLFHFNVQWFCDRQNTIEMKSVAAKMAMTVYKFDIHTFCYLFKLKLCSSFGVVKENSVQCMHLHRHRDNQNEEE